MTRHVDIRIDTLDVAAYTIPTSTPESDGTLTWDTTTLVVVEVGAGEVRGLGYTYADTATAQLIRHKLADVVIGRSALDVPDAWGAMVARVLLGSVGTQPAYPLAAGARPPRYL
jgi:L-alanine-DL-glutamate epimerase-like enolase superfamily enzyme